MLRRGRYPTCNPSARDLYDLSALRRRFSRFVFSALRERADNKHAAGRTLPFRQRQRNVPERFKHWRRPDTVRSADNDGGVFANVRRARHCRCVSRKYAPVIANDDNANRTALVWNTSRGIHVVHTPRYVSGYILSNGLNDPIYRDARKPWKYVRTDSRVLVVHRPSAIFVQPVGVYSREYRYV